MKTNTLIPFLCAADFFKKHTPTHHVIIAAYFFKYLSAHTFPQYFLFIDCFVDFTNLINILAVA